MTQEHSLRRRSLGLFLAMILIAAAAIAPVAAQSDVARQTVAITYPLDDTVTIKFRGTTRLPRLKGEAKVKRAGRRGTRVELSVENMPRATELGGVHTTYVLWAVSPEGRVDNLGEIKRSGSVIIDSKLDVTTPLQTFALIVTAEPHFLVRSPSRTVVLENLPPQKAGDAQIATINVQYIGNSSDYFRDPRVPDVADTEYRNTPVSLLGARQAIGLARYARAENFAADELREAEGQLELAENAWRLKQDEPEVDALARRATSLGARAEENAEARKMATDRRQELQRRDEDVRRAEESAATATQQIANLETQLQKEQRARDLVERELSVANNQLRDQRVELARLRDELQGVRAEEQNAKVKLARIEGERQAELERTSRERRASELKQSLLRFGSVKEIERGTLITLSESLWVGARSADLSPKASSVIEPLAALLANNPDYRLVIEAHTDNRGDQETLRKLTQDRADALAAQFASAGLDNARIQAAGMGGASPVAPNTTLSSRARNRRVELVLVPLGGQVSSTTNQ